MSRIVLRPLLLLIVLVSFVSCFRYTPSRKEMTDAGDSKIAGPEAFIAHQDELKARLDALVKERAPILGSDGSTTYKIGRRDTLKVDVFGFSDLSGESEVSDSGTISLPLVGMIQAAGHTTYDLQQELTEKFKRYIKQPIVRLSVTGYNAYKVSVVGAVVKPGWVPLRRPVSLLTDLITEVGGVKEGASDRLYIIPATPGATQPVQQAMGTGAAASQMGVEIFLEQLTGTLDQPPLQIPLVPGDIVIIPEAGQFRVDGEVEHPGSFAVTHRTSTITAVAAAGGFTYAANVNEVEVIRDIGAGKKASMTVDMEKVAFHGEPDISLRDGDVVVVPSAPGRFRARQVVESFRSILRGGVTGSIRYQ